MSPLLLGLGAGVEGGLGGGVEGGLGLGTRIPGLVPSSLTIVLAAGARLGNCVASPGGQGNAGKFFDFCVDFLQKGFSRFEFFLNFFLKHFSGLMFIVANLEQNNKKSFTTFPQCLTGSLATSESSLFNRLLVA